MMWRHPELFGPVWNNLDGPESFCVLTRHLPDLQRFTPIRSEIQNLQNFRIFRTICNIRCIWVHWWQIMLNLTKNILYSDNYNAFKLTAQHWATAYAGASYSNPDYESKLKSLKDMGVEEGSARVALSSCNWDVHKATEQLFNWELGANFKVIWRVFCHLSWFLVLILIR